MKSNPLIPLHSLTAKICLRWLKQILAVRESAGGAGDEGWFFFFFWGGDIIMHAPHLIRSSNFQNKKHEKCEYLTMVLTTASWQPLPTALWQSHSCLASYQYFIHWLCMFRFEKEKSIAKFWLSLQIYSARSKQDISLLLNR